VNSDSLDIAQIQAESIGWIPLEEGVYLHVSDYNATEVLYFRCCAEMLHKRTPK
jgi:hypothetical protein